MSDLFKSSRKCYLIDHHSPQPPVIPLNHLDIQEYEDFIDTADVSPNQASSEQIIRLDI